MMKRAIPLFPPRQRSPGKDERTPVPLDVFYFVQTTAGVIGKRLRRVCPPLYGTRQRPQIELMHLQTAGAGSGTYSIWKATTYLDPAEWLHDVVVANGALIRIRRRNPRPAPVSRGPLDQA